VAEPQRVQAHRHQALNSDAALVGLPPQPPGVPWPTPDPDGWPTGSAPPETEAVVDELIADTAQFGTTYAVLVIRGGTLLVERYGGEIPHFDRPAEPVGPTTQLLSWSMAKSVLHSAVGVLVGEGRLDPNAPAHVPAWHEQPGDPRAAITLEHLLTMRDGLDFAEDYVDAGVSDVIEMLFGTGQDDVAGYAEARTARHPPDTVFNYSSGTSNVVSAIAARAAGSRPALVDLLRQRIFEPIGMTSADPRTDAAGTFIGSSYVYATARDFARFGLLYLRDGTWDGHRLLPEGWVDHGRRQRSADEEGNGYGAHWWVVGDDMGSFRASGYEGQSILVCPGLDLLVVRLGYSTAEMYPALGRWRAAVVDASRS
jgi:CubicO group peptidase (beta-lactamase class C family)